MKSEKIFLFGLLFLALVLIFMPKPALADWKIGDPIVPQTCGMSGQDPCGIKDFFQMLVNLYSFIVIALATPLAVIAITVGGIFMMVSAGNPNLAGTGRKIIYTSIIGLILVFAAYLIIDFILCTTLGFCAWSNPF